MRPIQWTSLYANSFAENVLYHYLWKIVFIRLFWRMQMKVLCDRWIFNKTLIGDTLIILRALVVPPISEKRFIPRSLLKKRMLFVLRSRFEKLNAFCSSFLGKGTVVPFPFPLRSRLQSNETIFQANIWILSLLHLKRSSSHIAAALRATCPLLFWSTWPAAVDPSRS